MDELVNFLCKDKGFKWAKRFATKTLTDRRSVRTEYEQERPSWPRCYPQNSRDDLTGSSPSSRRREMGRQGLEGAQRGSGRARRREGPRRRGRSDRICTTEGLLHAIFGSRCYVTNNYSKASKVTDHGIKS